ncbi:MAG: 2-succinyl-6-hydroxy-2,4-cyclohexadiene-1-carboxylate synthase [Chlorobium sp.]|uniref:2-succinyl-6-hydroxy-2, 4-cyclohexadiene-1-carboxylate synthase n=1 Tax=Chlorobium sp. TaxID=1095 RepID=UPI0025BC8669|nr:2-succinyl-6-hydroxy-2,4-cyclohexadiene-1-carboxylate synthase [Chlorobium sp.]MCF8382994.1 2-succinyl-6-hydroxy-2,4-cyclohexadiene-1-carboxylate synthase [Chlorobium sp.]
MPDPSNFRILTRGSRNNPGIILLHGFLGSSEDWLPVTEKLVRDYYCMLFDLPGHGRTPAEVTPFEEQMWLLADTIGRVQDSPSFLAGYSMGGRIALYLALRFPGLFRKTVIISASPGLRTAEERLQRKQHDENLALSMEENFEKFLGSWYDLPLFSSLKNHPLFETTLEARKRNRPEQLATALRTLGTGTQPSLWGELADCRHHLSFFAGEKDGKYVEIGRQMVNLCPCSDLDIFPQCGHALHIENRELFIDRLLFSLTRE